MTKLLQDAFEAAQRLDAEAQDDLAAAILQLLAGNASPEQLDPAHLPGVLRGLVEAARGEFASEGEVEKVFRRFGK